LLTEETSEDEVERKEAVILICAEVMQDCFLFIIFKPSNFQFIILDINDLLDQVNDQSFKISECLRGQFFSLQIWVQKCVDNFVF
jgi:hypothetical protein